MKLSASLTKSKNSKGYYRDFEPIEVTTFQELGNLMLTHSLSSYLYSKEDSPTASGTMVPYRKAKNNIEAPGNVIFFDIDNKVDKIGPDGEVLLDDNGHKVKVQPPNPITLKMIKKVFQSLGWGCVIVPSRSSNKKWKKFHIACVVEGDIGDIEHFTGKYLTVVKQLGLDVDLAMKNGTQNLTPSEGQTKITVIDGKPIPFKKAAQDNTSTEIVKWDDSFDLHLENAGKQLTRQQAINLVRNKGKQRIGCFNRHRHDNRDDAGFMDSTNDNKVYMHCVGCNETVFLTEPDYGFSIQNNEDIDEDMSVLDRLKQRKVTDDDLLKLNKMKHLIKGFIVSGHHTYLFGAAGSKKTTLAASFCLDIAKKHDKEIYYFGFDVSLPFVHGFMKAIKKRKLDEKINLIYDITPQEFKDIVQGLVKGSEDLSNIFIVIDTFKFISGDINHKKSNQEAMHSIKSMLKLGATVLSLGHTNKDGDKQSGTAEIEQDSDAVFKIDRFVDDFEKVATVSIKKAGRIRFDHKDTSYTIPIAGKNENYWYQTIKGVKKVDIFIDVATKVDKAKERLKDKDNIEAIRELIPKDGITQTELTKLIAEENIAGKHKATELLNRYKDEEWSKKQNKKDNNKIIYKRITPMGMVS